MSDAPIPVKAMAALSMPRLAFTENSFRVMELVRMQFDVRKHTGAYWEQGLSRLLYQAVDEGFDYVLTVDYDTVFDAIDAWHLLRLMVAHPEAAAIFPVQYRRESDELLMSRADGRTKVTAGEFDGELSEAAIGHFGLTMLRVEALQQIPHPWLWSQPGPDGRWDDSRVDADVGFWHKLRKAGLRAFQANRVRVGHLQQVATYPGADLQPVHQYMSDHNERGRPDEVEELCRATG